MAGMTLRHKKTSYPTSLFLYWTLSDVQCFFQVRRVSIHQSNITSYESEDFIRRCISNTTKHLRLNLFAKSSTQLLPSWHLPAQRNNRNPILHLVQVFLLLTLNL